MQFFDLHCDTLYKAVTGNSDLDNPKYEVVAKEGKKFDKWCQCMAIWIPDEFTSRQAIQLFEKAYNKLTCESKRLGVSLFDEEHEIAEHSFIFTVENGSFLADNLDNIGLLQRSNVKMITLTWNAENCIGGGAHAQNTGLTDFGKRCVKELEHRGIIVDVSHSSDKTFYDVLDVSEKPIAASHSNSRKVCNNMRNLSDEQFVSIVKKQGIVGLNFHREFLSVNSEKASLTDVLKHTEHFLSLGGENTLCIGSDFDGSDIPKDLNNIRKIPDLYESYLKIGYNEQLVQKIMYNNAYNFFSRF